MAGVPNQDSWSGAKTRTWGRQPVRLRGLGPIILLRTVCGDQERCVCACEKTHVASTASLLALCVFAPKLVSSTWHRIARYSRTHVPDSSAGEALQLAGEDGDFARTSLVLSCHRFMDFMTAMMKLQTVCDKVPVRASVNGDVLRDLPCSMFANIAVAIPCVRPVWK